MSRGGKYGRTPPGGAVYRTERSFLEKVVDGAVDRLATLTGSGPVVIQLAYKNIRPGSLAIMFRNAAGETSAFMANDDGVGHVIGNRVTAEIISSARVGQEVGTVDYKTGEMRLDRGIVAGKVVDACYDYDIYGG